MVADFFSVVSFDPLIVQGGVGPAGPQGPQGPAGNQGQPGAPGDMTMASADNRYLKIGNNTTYPTLVVLGDSIMGNGDGPGSPGTGLANVSYHPRGFWVHALELLGHRLRFLSNMGVSGERTDQILLRVPSVTALTPGWCWVLAGTNDVGQGVPLSTIKTNLTAIWDQLNAAGIRIVAFTIPPRSSYTGTQEADGENLNTWIREQGRVRRNLIVVDLYASVVSPTATGRVYDVGMNFDSVHPSSIGAWVMGKATADVLSPLIPPSTELSSTEGEAGNLVKAGNRFATGGSGAVNTASFYSDHMAGTTWSKQARTDGVNGNWQVFTVTNGSGGWVQFNVAVDGTNLSIGDSVTAEVEYDISGLDQAAAANSQAFYLRLQSYNGTSSTDIMLAPYWVSGSTENMSARSRTGILKTPPVAIPTGTTILLVLIQMNGGGTYKLDRVTVKNVTTAALTGN